MPIKITTTIPNIHKPSRTENLSTVFLLPLQHYSPSMKRELTRQEVLAPPVPALWAKPH